MEQSSKYLPKTASALANLQESIAILEDASNLSTVQKQQLADKLSHTQQQMIQKATTINEIIRKLNGAIK
ncbi:MAG: hypothetical protein IJE43_16310 [Alphaproteobacteria bacterium]|nr:hypothetical protein [Alphaproteobacteria bacterium]